MKRDKYKKNLAKYKRSRFQDFESFLRTKIDLVEGGIKVVLDENESSFIIYELQLGIYSFKDISEALLNILQPKYDLFNNSVDIEFNGFTMKTKLVVRPGILAIRLDEKSFFSIILGFNPHWDYEHITKTLVKKL